MVRELTKSGIAVLYVSHFLEEVERIAERYTVLRDGKFVASGEITGTTRGDLVKLMAGRDVHELFPRSVRTPGELVLELKELAGRKLPSSASLGVATRRSVGHRRAAGRGSQLSYCAPFPGSMR